MKSSRRAQNRSLSICLAAVAAALTLVVAPSGALAATRVEMRNFEYKPNVVHVKVGKRVLFVNGDRTRHDAFARGIFDTGRLGFGESATVKFSRRGIYPYYCTLHASYMRGKVVVE